MVPLVRDLCTSSVGEGGAYRAYATGESGGAGAKGASGSGRSLFNGLLSPAEFKLSPSCKRIDGFNSAGRDQCAHSGWHVLCLPFMDCTDSLSAHFGRRSILLHATGGTRWVAFKHGSSRLRMTGRKPPKRGPTGLGLESIAYPVAPPKTPFAPLSASQPRSRAQVLWEG